MGLKKCKKCGYKKPFHTYSTICITCEIKLSEQAEEEQFQAEAMAQFRQTGRDPFSPGDYY